MINEKSLENLVHKWGKGTSGNPGRPKESIGELLKDYIYREDNQKPRVLNIIETLYKMASNENNRSSLPAIQEIMNRIDGKVADKLDVRNVTVNINVDYANDLQLESKTRLLERYNKYEGGDNEQEGTDQAQGTALQG